jgi:hypothetical protein
MHMCMRKYIHTIMLYPNNIPFKVQEVVFFCDKMGSSFYVPKNYTDCIATSYGLDRLGIESRCEMDFSHLSRPALGPNQSPIKWIPGLSRGKAAGAWR